MQKDNINDVQVEKNENATEINNSLAQKEEKQLKKESNDNAGNTRILSIDRFRGICMFAVICSFMFGIFPAFEFLAPVLGHGAEGFQILPGVSFADLFAAMFIFVIGLTIVKSFKSRERKYGTRKAYWQLAIRFLGLIGIGALLNGFENGWSSVFLDGQKFSELSVCLKWLGIMFWIAIALVLNLIVSRFFKCKKYKTISEMMLRYLLAFAGVMTLFFMIIGTAEIFTPRPEGWRYDWEWDILQNIGLTGLLSLPFLKMDKWGRLIIAGIIFVVYTLLIQNGFYPYASRVIEGGLIGSFGWLILLLLGSVFVELKDDKLYWVLTSLFLLISVVAIVGLDFIAAKRGCTPVYALFCSSVSAMVWGGLNYLNNWRPKFGFFEVWGSNAILSYVVGYILMLIMGGLLGETFATIGIAGALPIVIVILALFTLMNWLLKRKNNYIRM